MKAARSMVRSQGAVSRRGFLSRVATATAGSAALSAQGLAAETGIRETWRIVSSDRAANSALRVQASCMAMGQAAGAAATLAARAGITPARGLNGLDVFPGVPRLETPPLVIDGMLLSPRGGVNCRIRRAMGVCIPAAGDCAHVFSQLVDRLVGP